MRSRVTAARMPPGYNEKRVAHVSVTGLTPLAGDGLRDLLSWLALGIHLVVIIKNYYFRKQKEQEPAQ